MELSVVEQRYQAVMEVLSDGLTVTEVAERYGVSRQIVHRWIRRYEQSGLNGLADRSHRPKSCAHQTSADVEAAICELRRLHSDWGPRTLLDKLEKRGVTPLPSRSSIYRVLVRNNLIEPKRRRRRKLHYKRWERKKPMELWQLDIWVRSFLAMAPSSRSSPGSTITRASASSPSSSNAPRAGLCAPPSSRR
jgi:transposase